MDENLKELNQIAMGRRIRLAREALELSREALAEKMDVSAQFIADIEYGNKGLSIRNLFLLKQVLRVTADYILGGNVYAIDKGGAAARACEDIIALLSPCTESQIENFKEISRIFAENVAPEENLRPKDK